MGYRARVLNVLHVLSTILACVLLIVAYSCNDWIRAELPFSDSMYYTSGIFHGCFGLKNLTTVCSSQIQYGAKGTFNFKYNENPITFIERLTDISIKISQKEEIDPLQFQPRLDFFDEGTTTFTTDLYLSHKGDSWSIFTLRLTIAIGLFITTIGSMFTFFSSCAYKIRSAEIATGFYFLGVIIICWGTNIFHIPIIIDIAYPPANFKTSMGFGLKLSIASTAIFLFLALLASVTLESIKSARIRDIHKEGNMVNEATLAALNVVQNTMRMNRDATMQMTLRSTRVESGRFECPTADYGDINENIVDNGELVTSRKTFD